MLSRRDFREADRFYSVLTPTHGKIEFLARGGHKPLAKLTPHLEAVAEVELLLVSGRVFQTVAGVERRRSFPHIFNDLQKLLLAQNSLSLVDLATRPHERDPILYKLILSWLDFIETSASPSDERSAFLLGSFLLKLMAISGYRPELTQCLSCREAIAAGNFYWHALKGGVVCASCVVRDQEQWFSARRIDDATLKLLRFASQESFSNQTRPTLAAEQIVWFHEVLESYLICHFPVIPSVSIRAACISPSLA
ncbi:DNA repair protein RecO [Candidatus Uhrbacteria bacterium]|nr:DNA repair protein RecO [Candidatus Uhrbacteria bacterium]